MNKKEVTPYSKLGKSNRQILKDILPLEKPFTIFIEPSNSCNFRCLQCPHGLDDYEEKAGPIGNMSEEVFSKLLNDMIEWKKDFNEKYLLKVIRLYLEGEPLINPRYCEMLRQLKENNIAERIELVTNGSLLSKEICEKLVEYGLDYITISIYSVIEEKNKHITRSDITPTQIRDNIKYLRKIRDEKNKATPFIYVKIIDTYNEEENNTFKQYYEGISDEACIEKPMNWNNPDEGDFIGKLYDEDSQKVREDMNNRLKYRKACPFPFHTLSIKTNGDVLVCCVDWIRGTNVGNIMESSLKDIWNGDKLFQLRKLHIEGQRSQNKSCNGCELFFKLSEEDNIDEVKLEQIEGK